MIRQHKKMILLTSIATLLPILIGLLLWKQLPDSVATHWSTGNEPDGYSSKAFAVFGLPVDHADPASGMRDRNEH